MNEPNQNTYASAGIVGYYTQLKQLQPAEKVILERLKPQLSSMRMLDIGIGGGRTTTHFAPLAKEYVGIDYSAEMIAACRERLSKAIPSLSPEALEVMDARSMEQFPDHSFDFILFSFNGIDYVSEGDRLKIFEEVKRVGKPGGYFAFSSHNLQGLQASLTLKKSFSLNPLRTYTNLVMLGLFKLLNPTVNAHQLATADHLIVRDESHNFRLQTYYIRPKAQLKQLEPFFKNIEVYSWSSGLNLRQWSDSSQPSDMWLYYLCAIR